MTKKEPTLVDLKKWLQTRILAMKNTHHTLNDFSPAKATSKKKPDLKDFSTLQTRVDSETTEIKCSLCRKNHNLWKCSEYLNKSSEDRLKTIKKKTLCFNCLKPHHVKKCSSKHSCFIEGCKSKHDTSLHESFKSTSANADEDNTEDKATNGIFTKTATNFVSKGKQVYLKVVPVRVKGVNGKHCDTYVLLDDAS